jgi:predicted enzyme related to lactoylglutathione lyase
MAIKSIDLGWITVSDFAKAKKFFVEHLGLTINSVNEEMGWLELKGKDGGALLGIAKAHEQETHRPGSNTVLTLKVDDIEKTKQELEAKDVTFLGGILEVPGHVKLATFIDPDKNVFQLVQDLNQ